MFFDYLEKGLNISAFCSFRFLIIPKGYRSFLEGVDNYKELEDDLARNFDSRNQDDRDQIAELEFKNEELLHEILAIRNAPDRLEEMEKKKETLKYELGKSVQDVQELQEMEHSLNLKLVEMTDEKTRLRMSLLLFIFLFLLILFTFQIFFSLFNLLTILLFREK
jgi:SMC interacting uncharacterized protein involved in chromosome segregation